MPQILVGAPESLSDGFPGSARIRVSLAQSLDARLRIADAGVRGAKLRVSVNGLTVIEHVWEAVPPPERIEGHPAVLPERRPRAFTVPLSAGDNDVVVENIGGADWVEFESLDFGMNVSAIGAVGKRSERFAAFWLWRREGVFALPDAEPAGGFLIVDDLGKARWRVTWWDTVRGEVMSTSEVDHAGGECRLIVPEVSRHTAVVLEREG